MDEKLSPPLSPLDEKPSFGPNPLYHSTDLAPLKTHKPPPDLVLPTDNNQSEPAPTLKVTHVNKYSEENDPPLIDVKVTNPITYLKRWLKRLLANEGIDLGFKLRVKPLTAIAIMVALAASFGTGYGTGLNAAAGVLFPNSSPILHRSVVYQGIFQKGEGSKYYLTLPNSDLYTLKPKASSSINFNNLENGSVLVKGNLTRESFVIEVSEIIPLEITSLKKPVEDILVNEKLASPSALVLELPKIYPDIQWEVAQKKVLLFTSGKRRIEQEGVYLESIQVGIFPQNYLDYYTQSLNNLSFNQTFKSADPAGITITYAKDDTYFTFGIKNIYQGSGEKKQLIGYKTFIEHN